VPWVPELFSAPALARLLGKRRRDELVAVPYFYDVVRWDKTELPPQAGVAVYVRGQTGKLAAARIYDDTDPPL
jgi:hypothetical protein